MVTTHWKGDEYKVILVNRGQWFGETWFILTENGAFAVEADNEQDALDELIDSKHYHLIAWPTDEPEEEWTAHGGNCGKPYNSELVIAIERCKVNYFA